MGALSSMPNLYIKSVVLNWWVGTQKWVAKPFLEGRRSMTPQKSSGIKSFILKDVFLMTQFAFNSRIFSGGDSSSCPLLTSRFGSVSLLEKFMLKRAKNKPKCAQNLSKWDKI